MEEKLQEILDKYSESIDQWTNEKNRLSAKIEFCHTHLLLEEERITRIEYNAIQAILIKFKAMHYDIQELLNNWLS